MKLISILTPCFNEELNIQNVYLQIKAEIQLWDKHYIFEHIFIDNASNDETFNILKDIASSDKSVKIIRNSRNFGPIRSGYHGILQCRGDAVIPFFADLQEPVSLISEFIKKWEEGFLVVKAVKSTSHESWSLRFIKRFYYYSLNRISDLDLTENYNGIGLYDKRVIEILKEMKDPYPFFRGMIAEIGFSQASVFYIHNRRVRGISKNNFYTLYDSAMLGLTSYSKLPLRLAVLSGFTLAFICLVAGLFYLVIKLLYWEAIPFGVAPLLIGMFFLGSIQLIFIGILGEYIGAVHTQVLKRPLVVEQERLNF